MDQLKNWMSSQNAAQHAAQHEAQHPAAQHTAPNDPALETDLFDSIENSPPPHPPILQRSDPPKTSPLAPPPKAWHPYKKMLKAEDVGFFDPGFQASEQKYRKTTPSPVVNAGKHTYYLDIFVFIDRLKALSRKYGQNAVQDVIPSCLRGSALTWWTTEVDEPKKMILEASKDLEP